MQPIGSLPALKHPRDEEDIPRRPEKRVRNRNITVNADAKQHIQLSISTLSKPPPTVAEMQSAPPDTIFVSHRRAYNLNFLSNTPTSTDFSTPVQQSPAELNVYPQNQRRPPYSVVQLQSTKSGTRTGYRCRCQRSTPIDRKRKLDCGQYADDTAVEKLPIKRRSPYKEIMSASNPGVSMSYGTAFYQFELHSPSKPPENDFSSENHHLLSH